MDFAKAKIFLIILVISLFAPDMVLAMPPPPEIPVLFYGTLTVNQAPAPVGTVVSIRKKDGQAEIASNTTQTAGRYFLEVPCKNYIGEMMVFRINNLISISQERQCVDVMTAPSVKLDLSLDMAKVAVDGGGIPLWLLQQQQPKPVVTPSKEEAPIAPTPQLLGEKIYADGTLLRGKDKKVYIIANGQKKHVPNLKELAKYAGQKIYDVENIILIQYPEVLGIKVFADGMLIRGADARIYVIKNNKKQHIRSLEELRKNYFGKKIYDVSDETLAKY